MIGMILVTHDNIGVELLKALDAIVGPQPQAKAITIGMHDDMSECRDQILSAIKTVNSGQGVMILVDMFGGTPSNLAIASMPMGNAVVLAGVNLPMLIKFASVRATMSLLDAAREAEAAGRKYIQLISENIAPGQVA
jgi:PTS system mannose-specific IIA component